MKRVILFIAVVLFVSVGCKNEVEMAPNEVVLSGLSYNPITLNVPFGTTISWVNNDATISTVTSDSALFDSGNMGKGNVFNYTFTKSGTFTYHNKYQSGMTGSIIVQSDTVFRNIVILNFSFSPSSLAISPGTFVKWTNNDPITHTVTSNTSVFDSGDLNPGNSFNYTFRSAGSFPYHCNIHPSMTGIIVVL